MILNANRLKSKRYKQDAVWNADMFANRDHVSYTSCWWWLISDSQVRWWCITCLLSKL